ncbi:uncharacterized protein [Nicotiana tomentosiformis]|uniref:uncharacterized protein n=1 Tax=Nicotiana tomentosiformis TaxID=4098 RepID=UPI00388C6CE0
MSHQQRGRNQRRGTSKVRDPTIAVTSEALALPPPPQQVRLGEDCAASVSDPLNVRMGLTKASLDALNQHMGEVLHNFQALESTTLDGLDEVKESVDQANFEHKEGLTNLELKLTEVVSALHGEIELLKQQLKAVELAGGTGRVMVRETKIEGPKSKEFRGERDAQEVEKFIWKMEDYFEHLYIADKAAKIWAATVYLAETAMLWWRRKKADMEKGICSIKSWDQFKFELKRQFYPQNVVNEARKKLRELRQTTSISEYVENFTKLIMQIPNLASDDLLFTFIDGLQDWARQELQQRQVKDVDEAIAVAESLNDYRTEPTKARDTNFQTDGDHGYQDRGKQVAAPDCDSREQGNQAPWRNRYNQRRKDAGPRHHSYICKDTSHSYKDCPSLKKLGAIITTKRKLTEERIQAGEQAREQLSHIAHLGNMVLGAVVAEKPALKQVAQGKHNIVKLVHALGDDVIGKERQSVEPGSLFMDAQLNRQSVRIMVDTGATHNFVSEAKAKSLGLVFGPSSSVLKMVNAKPTNVKGIARNVQLNIGAWQGNVSFLVASLDVFDLVLGLDYWDAVKAFICPFLNQIYIYDPRGPCVVQAVRVPQVVSLLSAIQTVKGFKEEGAPVLAVGTGTKEVKRDKALTPSEQRVLKGKDLIVWMKPPAKGPYMAPPKLEDSRKQR